MLITLVVGVDPNLPVRDGHRIAEAVNHELIHAFSFTTEALVHIDPSGEHEVPRQDRASLLTDRNPCLAGICQNLAPFVGDSGSGV